MLIQAGVYSHCQHVCVHFQIKQIYCYEIVLSLTRRTLLHSERPKLYAILIFLSAVGLKLFLTYETEFVLFLAVLENSVLPIGRDSSHGTLKVTSELF